MVRISGRVIAFGCIETGSRGIHKVSICGFLSPPAHAIFDVHSLLLRKEFAMAKLFENPRFIAIEGPIRAGKSTLTTLLAQEIGATRVSEPRKSLPVANLSRRKKRRLSHANVVPHVAV